MDFKQAVTVCLRKYADFNGRASRPEYWWFALFTVLVSVAASFLFGHWLQLLVNLALLLPSLAAGARRLHDMGKSGWFLLVSLIPLVGWVLAIYWLAQPSVGANAYGDAPSEVVTVAPPGAA